MREDDKGKISAKEKGDLPVALCHVISKLAWTATRCGVLAVERNIANRQLTTNMFCRSHIGTSRVTNKHVVDASCDVFILLNLKSRLCVARGTFGAFLCRGVRGLVPCDHSRRFGAFESASVWVWVSVARTRTPLVEAMLLC